MLLLSGNELEAHSMLHDTMFRDRGIQFHDRLKWDVKLDKNGHERDEFDTGQTLYLLSVGRNGEHVGSMRLLPTMGKTFIAQNFSYVKLRIPIRCHRTWECTRFCIAPHAGRDEARRILAGLLEFGIKLDISYFVGVFDSRMQRIYQKIGWTPEVIGVGSCAREQIFVGLWAVDDNIRHKMHY